jgi:ABC-type branched-subunit amino acid transport system substrate-binding protein
MTWATAKFLTILMAAAMIAAACGGGGDSSEGDGSASGDDAATDGDTGDDGSTDGGDTSPGDDGDGSADDGDADGSPSPGDDDGSSGDDSSDSDGDGDEPAEPAGPPAETNGFDGETIKLGYLIDQTASLSTIGAGLLAGSQAYWDSVNAAGGVAGQYRVELVAGDTQDQEGVTVQEYQRIKNDVVMIAEVLSTPPTQALIEFLEEDNILATPGSLSYAWTAEPQLVPNGTPYEFEMINLADWYVNESGLAQADDVYCVVHFDDKYGQDTVRGVEHAADELGIDLAVSTTVSRGATSFTAAISELEDCTVVFAITVVFEQLGLMTEADALGFDPVWLGALPSYLNLFAISNPGFFENFYVALDTPGFDRDDVPGMAEFLDVWAEYGSGNPDTFRLSGYFQTISVHALLEKAVELGDLSREGMVEALAQLGEVDVRGLADNYVYGTPENRLPASASRISVFDQASPPNFLRELAIVDSPLTETFSPS